MPHFIRVDETWRDVEYEKKVFAYLHDNVPDKVFDAHSHISKWEIDGVPEDQVFDYAYFGCTEKAIGKGKLKGALTMGNPYDYQDEAEYEDDRLFSCENGQNHEGFVTGLLVRPWDKPEDVEAYLRKYPKIVALKPYWVYARQEGYETDILDYAPMWIWELADKWGLVVVLHMSHYIRVLSNESNAKTIRMLCKKFPNMVMQLAHCAMGHNPYMLKNGLKHLEGLDNVWMDMSGVTEALAMVYCIRDFDRHKVMFGTDGWNYGHNMLGRCYPVGETFQCMYTGTPIPEYHWPPYLFKGLTPATENLIATMAAADILKLTPRELEDVFYNNAANLYYPRIRK